MSADVLGLVLEEIPEALPADAIGLTFVDDPEPQPLPASAIGLTLLEEPQPLPASALVLTPLDPEPLAADAIGLALTEVESDPDLDDLGLSLDDEPAQPARVLLGAPSTPPPPLRGAPASPPVRGAPVAQGVPVARGAPIEQIPVAQGVPEPAEPPIPMMEGIDLGRDSTALRPRKKAPPKPSEKRRAKSVTLEPGAAPEMDGFEGTGVGDGAGRRRQTIKDVNLGEVRHCSECGFEAPLGLSRCTNCGCRLSS